MAQRRKLRVLAWMDSPLSITGFGIVAKNILGRMYKTGRFDIACVGINHVDEHFEKAFEDRSEVPYKVFVGRDQVQKQSKEGIHVQVGDPMGREKLIQMMKAGGIDIVFLMRDLWDMCVPNWRGRPHLASYLPLHIQLAKEQGRNFRVLTHFPMEYTPKPEWRAILDQMDYGLCFTAGGMKHMKQWDKTVKWCPQGADGDVFKPLPDSGWGPAGIMVQTPGGWASSQQFIKDREHFRTAKMRLPDPNCFLMVNVNRNQPRKDVRSSLVALRKLKERIVAEHGADARKPVLWLQMRPDDNFGDARKLAEEEGLTVDHDILFPPYFNVGVGWTEQELNMLYNAADAFISTSVAEGFGLTPVEAGMAGCPVFVAGHTGHLQTITHLGMPLIKCLPQEVREYVSHAPISPTDTDDMAQKLFEHYQDETILDNSLRKHLKEFRDRFSWDNIFERYWEPTLRTIEKDILGTGKRRDANKDRTLFVCEEAAGDIIGASKAVRALKEKFPNRPIDFLCKPQFKDILGENPFIDRLLDWDINKIFDYPVTLYPHSRIRHGSWNNCSSHLLDMQCEMIGLAPPKAPDIICDPFDPLLDDVVNVNDPVWPIITINAASQGGKMLPLQQWELLIAVIVQKFPDIRFVQVGGPKDAKVRGAIDFRFDPTEDGKALSFRRMAWIQKHAVAHIGIDSGPGHFADAVGTPSIITWGWTNYATCAPQRFSINITPHYPTVCPQMGPCHGVSPRCGVNQYDQASALKAPCANSVRIDPVVELLKKALGTGDLMAAKNWLKEKATKRKRKPIYTIPQPPKFPDGTEQKALEASEKAKPVEASEKVKS